jgi:hypothetical protein
MNAREASDQDRFKKMEGARKAAVDLCAPPAAEILDPFALVGCIEQHD